MRAYVFINVAAGKSGDVLQQVRRTEGVTSAEICWGLPDIIAVAQARDSKALQGLVLDKIQQIAGVTQTDTHIVCE